MTVLDSKMSTLHSISNYSKTIMEKGRAGPVRFYCLSGLSTDDDTELRILFEVVYEYDPVTEPEKKLTEPCHSCESDLPEYMLSLLESAQESDITINVGNETIKAHKNILVTRSIYFETMFGSGMQESLTNEIRVDDADPALFKEVLQFIYSGLPPRKIGEIAMELFTLADRFSLMPLKDICISSIEDSLSSENVIDVLLLGDLHACDRLVKKCIPVFKKHLSELRKGENWQKLKEKSQLLAMLLASFGDQ